MGRGAKRKGPVPVEQTPRFRLAELYGVVVTPEQAQKHYRRHGWITIVAMWTMNLLIMTLIVTFMRIGGAS